MSIRELCVAMVLVGCLLPPARPAGQALSFGPAKDLSALEVSKRHVTASLEAVAVESTTVTFQIDPQRCRLHSAPEGHQYMQLEDLKPTGRPGEPQLPMKTFTVTLEKDAEVYGVEVTAGKFSGVAEDLDLVPMPELSAWQANSEGGKYIRDEKVYGLDRFFPGKLVSYETGEDRQHRYVLVRVFPLQYVPSRRHAVVVTEAVINVYYGPPRTEAAIQAASATAVIICPTTLQAEAQDLATFHNNSNPNLSTTVITTADIDRDFEAALDPPFSGFKNSTLSGWSNIKNYNYTLARKIVAYLRLEQPAYVTVLGDALLVPPSYYYSANGGSYDDWMPTDFLYASPDYDFVLNSAVGRLSVSSASEARNVIAKIKAWQPDWSWFNRAYLAAGNPHPNHYYCAEMNTAEAVNKESFSGMALTKCFHTDGAFTKSCTEPALTHADVGILYHLGHGSGTGISLDGNGITATDLMRYSTNVETPVVFSVSCNNGDFDSDLTGRKVAHSFGEAVLKSRAGGIAYVGGSRHNVGDGVYTYDEYGNVNITKLTYVVGLFDDFFAAYHSGVSVLGDLCLQGLQRYVQSNDMAGDPVNAETVFRHVLLGDPALQLPAQQPATTEYSRPTATTEPSAVSHSPTGIPIYAADPKITASTTSPTVEWKLIDVNADLTLARYPDSSSPFTFTSSYGANSQYLVRTAAEPGSGTGDYAKENWLFYTIGQPPSMRVSGISVAVKTSGQTKYAVATVTVTDDAGVPVGGVNVSGSWTGLTTDADTASTGRTGQVVLNSDKVSNSASGTFTFCVNAVWLSGWIYTGGMSCGSAASQ